MDGHTKDNISIGTLFLKDGRVLVAAVDETGIGVVFGHLGTALRTSDEDGVSPVGVAGVKLEEGVATNISGHTGSRRDNAC